MECSWQICVFMIFDKRLSDLQRLQGSDFDGKVVFVFFFIGFLTAVCSQHMTENFRSWGSEEPMSKQSGVVVFCDVADCELLAFVILVWSVQMMLATNLN